MTCVERGCGGNCVATLGDLFGTARSPPVRLAIASEGRRFVAGGRTVAAAMGGGDALGGDTALAVLSPESVSIDGNLCSKVSSPSRIDDAWSTGDFVPVWLPVERKDASDGPVFCRGGDGWTGDGDLALEAMEAAADGVGDAR